MSSFPGRELPSILHTPSQSAALHHTETCNIVIFGETGAGKSSSVNLVSGTQTALTSCDATGCTTESNAYDVLIQNETFKLKVKLFDTVGLGEGPEGTVPDKDARRILKKLIRDLMKQTDIHLLMYCVRGVRVTKALCRNYNLIHSEVKERIPIVLVATGLEDKRPEMEEWWRDNERSISDFGMTFAGHACITTATIDRYAGDELKRRRTQSYHAICQLIEQCRLSQRVQTPLSDVGRNGKTPRTHILPMSISRKKHKDIVLARETAASAGSLVHHAVAEEIASTAPDLRLCTLQDTATVDLHYEIFKALETIRLKDPHLEIKEYSIPPEMGASDDDKNIILAEETDASVGSHVNIMAGDEVAPTASDMQRRMLQCSETVDPDDKTFEAIETIRLEDPHIGIKEYPITSDIDDENNDVALPGEIAESNSSRINLVVGGGVAPTAPDIECRMLQWSEIVDSDDETSEVPGTIRLEDPHLGIRQPTLMSRKNDVVLARKTTASNGSLVNLMVGDVIVRTAPDVLHHLLQWSKTVYLDDNTFKVFLRLVNLPLRAGGYTSVTPKIGIRNQIPSFLFFPRRKDLHMEITVFLIPPNIYTRNKHTIMVLFRQTGANKSSLVNILAREKVARPAPDMRRHLLQCTEAVDETSVETFLRSAIIEYLVPPELDARKKHELVVLFWQTGTGNRSLINLTTGEPAASTPNMLRRIQCSEPVNLDNKTFKVFSRFEDPHLRIRGYHIPRNMGARNDHKIVTLFWQTRTGKSSPVNLMARKEVTPRGPDMQRRMLQCSETIDLDDRTSEVFLRSEDPPLKIREYSIPPKISARRTKRQSIVLFGDTGAGKSSLINLMAGKKVARTSPDMQRCTMHWQEYDISFGDTSYKVYDTIGLEAPQLGIKEYLEFVENAYQLVKQLDKQGGIDLLLFCVRAGRVTATLQNNYRLFHEFLCEKKIPIVLAITNLERENRMEDWWERNKGTFDKYQIKVAGHACITTADRLDGRHKDLYEESRVTIHDLIDKFTANEQKQTWSGGDNLFVSLTRKLKGLLKGSSHVRRKDLVPHLTKGCGISREVAKQLANMIKHDVEAT